LDDLRGKRYSLSPIALTQHSLFILAFFLGFGLCDAFDEHQEQNARHGRAFL